MNYLNNVSSSNIIPINCGKLEQMNFDLDGISKIQKNKISGLFMLISVMSVQYGLSLRAKNILMRNKIYTLGDVINRCNFSSRQKREFSAKTEEIMEFRTNLINNGLNFEFLNFVTGNEVA